MDSVCLATAGDDIKLWDHGFSLLRSFNPYTNRNVASLAWNFEGTLLASSAVESDHVVLTYTKNALMTTIELPCGAGVQCTDFTSDSRFLLCGGTEGVSVWDLKTSTLKKSFQGHKSPVTTARYNWNHSYIASGSKTGEIILHNTVSGQSSSPIVAPNTQAILQLEYSTSKKSMFGTASDNGAVTLWDANTRRMLHSFKDAHISLASGLAFSPINEMLMMSVGLDKRFVCYDIQRKRILKVFEAQSPLTCIDIMQDGATAAVGSTQGKVYIYDLRQGGSTPIQVLQAHKTSVQSVKFVPASKSKTEESSNSMKANVSAGSRRQLPPAPTVMQDITPSKTGQTPDVQSCTPAANSSLGMDIISPLAGRGNGSLNQSKSASLINLTNSRGEDSVTGVFSPLTKGLAGLSAMSQSGCHGASLLSLSFLNPQTDSHIDSINDPASHNTSTAAKSAVKGQSSHTNSLLHTEQPIGEQNAKHVSYNDTHMSQSAGRLSQNAEHLSHNVTAGHLSHLHQSGTVHSPVVGHLSHPQMSSSLQTSVAESSAHGAGRERPARQWASTGQGVADQSDRSQSAVTQNGGLVMFEDHNRSRSSASPDSAAISGGEDGESGMSPRQAASQPSLPFTTRPALAGRTTSTAGDTAAGPVDVGAAGEPGVIQRELLKSLITDAMEDFRSELHRDIQNLHVSVLRQFFNWEREFQSTMSHYSEMNQKLLMTVRQLEEENKRLKKNY